MHKVNENSQLILLNIVRFCGKWTKNALSAGERGVVFKEEVLIDVGYAVAFSAVNES